MIDHDLVGRAREAAEAIAPLSSAIEAQRRLPPEAVAALARAGAFKLLVPRAYGGAETTGLTLLSVIEEIARADGSAGWCTMIGATSGLMSAWLPEALAKEVYGADDAITSGVFAPIGKAVATEGGYRVSGRWPFASGCEHSSWRMGGVMVEGEEGPKSILFKAEETRVIDTWSTSGLCGTGSHDVEVNDLFVPRDRMFSLFSKPRHEGALYRMPFFGLLAAGVASVSLGIARAAIDAIVTLAKKKTPVGSKRGIAHRELVQLQIAQAEAKVQSARAFLHQAMAHVEAGSPDLRTRALLRLAASHAATESAAAVDLAYEAGGATSIYSKHPLQRHFRDVHVATQHMMVSSQSTVLAGRILLDLESDTSTL
ncbi:MAG: acyl-CoA dehydrogenase family protein [Polyangiales bacterium]